MSREMPEFVAPLVVPVVPIDTMNKKDLYKHLTEFHGGRVNYNLTSKSSKDRMEEFHAALHERVDYTQTSIAVIEVHDEEGRVTGRYNVENPVKHAEGEKEFAVWREKVHEHVVVPVGPPSENERKTLDAVTDGTLNRVLSVTERKALERLIDNDFATLRNEMNAYAKDVLEERLKGVAEDFADKAKEAEKHRKAAIKAVTDANAKVVKVIEDAKAAGITLDGVTLVNYSEAHYDNKIKAVVQGQTDAEMKVRAENRSDVQNALHTLERQRLASQRLVLLAGISSEGQKLLNTIPDAKTLMVEAAQERATRQITA